MKYSPLTAKAERPSGFHTSSIESPPLVPGVGVGRGWWRGKGALGTWISTAKQLYSAEVDKCQNWVVGSCFLCK